MTHLRDLRPAQSQTDKDEWQEAAVVCLEAFLAGVDTPFLKTVASDLLASAKGRSDD